MDEWWGDTNEIVTNIIDAENDMYDGHYGNIITFEFRIVKILKNLIASDFEKHI